MGPLREITENLSVFDYSRFFFKSQTLVVYSVSAHGYSRLSKISLIAAIRYYLLQLDMLGLNTSIKRGFVLYKFKYFELSVYLHGLIQVYCSMKGFPPIGNLFITRFSHLPHDVLKPEKRLINIEYAVLHDIAGKDYCVCLTDVPIFADTYNGLLEKLSRTSFARKFRFNLILVNELPF